MIVEGYTGPTTAALVDDVSERTELKDEREPRAPATDLLREVRAGGAPALGENSVVPVAVADALAADERATPLFSSDETKGLRARWDTVQGGFVDEPRHAVEEADALVVAATKRLAEMFAAERAALEGQWDRQETVSTEDLRLALRRYRSFFGRLLSV
jgi:hypothetical protein